MPDVFKPVSVTERFYANYLKYLTLTCKTEIKTASSVGIVKIK